MKKFVFTLQTLLNVRQMEEDRIKGELAEANAELARRVAALDAAINDKSAHEAALMDDISNGKANVQTFETYDRYLTYIREVIAERDAAVTEQRETVRGIQERLVRALQDKKVLEKLKDKQYEEYLTEVKLEEDKAIDDFMSYKIVST